MRATYPTGRSREFGFTLLELMIVLSLLALFVAIVWPSLSKPLSRSWTQTAARQLATDLARARLNAIESGRAMVIRYEPGGTRYLITPADTLSGSGQSSASSESTSDQADASITDDDETPPFELVIEGVLDNDVVFRDPTAIDEDGFPRDSTLGQLLRDEMEETEEVQPLIQDETQEASWSPPTMIYPTGRAENAEFVLSGLDGYSVTVTLRGLTGAVSIGSLIRDQRGEDTSALEEDSYHAPPPGDTVNSFDNQGARRP